MGTPPSYQILGQCMKQLSSDLPKTELGSWGPVIVTGKEENERIVGRSKPPPCSKKT